MTDRLSAGERVDRAVPPDGPVSLVLDTDAYNEVDDQFAIVHAIQSRHDVEALYAAPFHNERSDGPADGMERSYDEIQRVLDRLDASRPVLKGGTEYVTGADESAGPTEATPVRSEATADLVERAHADRDGPLYVVAIGAATNVASALLADPTLTEELVVVWLGGTTHGWHTAAEFNLSQDPVAARVLFESGVSLVHVPATNVAEHLRTTVPELRERLAGTSEIGAFLTERVAGYDREGAAWSKVIWDLAATAVLATPDAVDVTAVPSPILTSEQTWSHDQARHRIGTVRTLDRDAIFADLFESLAE